MAYRNTKFKFKGKIEFRPDLINKNNIVLRHKVLKLIVNEYYYFDPKYFSWDTKKRIIYSLDKNIVLQLNFQFVNVDINYLLWILSVMELDLLGILERGDSEKLIQLACSELSVNFRSIKRNLFGRISRLVNGKEVESWVVLLYSEEFVKEIKETYSKLSFRLTSKGFVSSKSLDSS